MVDSTLPNWTDSSSGLGTMARTALWLIQEVGIGNTFTKEQHRTAFSGITQADRRLRDLRSHGWIIQTNQEDVSLNSSEQRFKAIGLAVWDPLVRRANGAPKLTDKQRMEVFERTDYQCAICGIAGGESYQDGIGATAILSAVRHSRTTIAGGEETLFAAECKRCTSGNKGYSEDLPEFLRELDSLEPEKRIAMLRFIADDRNGSLSRLWRDFRKLSTDSQLTVKKLLGNSGNLV
jgi:hypothetical protein